MRPDGSRKKRSEMDQKLENEADMYVKFGGKWLGAARRWIQHNCWTGSTVMWGSSDLLPPLSVDKIEELAAEIARATFLDLKEGSK